MGDIVEVRGKKYDIETKEGAREYLEDEGFDVDMLIEMGMAQINEWYKSMKSVTKEK